MARFKYGLVSKELLNNCSICVVENEEVRNIKSKADFREAKMIYVESMEGNNTIFINEKVKYIPLVILEGGIWQ